MKPRKSAPRALSFVAFCHAIGVPLSEAQRVLAAVAFDGAPVPPEASDLFGGLAGTPPPEALRTIVWLCGRNSGKSRTLAAYILWRCLTADLRGIARGEIAFGAVVAPSVELAGQALRFARGMLDGTPFEKLVISETKDSFTIRRPDGRLARFGVFAASRGGVAGRGRTIVAAALDEACFFRDEASGVINDAHVHDAIAPRVLAGGAIVLASTPWIQEGLLYSLWAAELGKPRTAFVAVAPTERMRPDDAELLARIEAARERDADSAAREFDCAWLPPGSGNAFDASSLADAVREDAELEADETRGMIFVGGDLGLVNDPSAFVAVRVAEGAVTVLDAIEMRPRKGAPLSLAFVLREAADFRDRLEEKHGACVSASVAVDHHSLTVAREIIERERIRLNLDPCDESADAREARFSGVADKFAAGLVRVPRRLARLNEQLSRITRTPRSGGGYRYEAARRGGDHADMAMALLLACAAAQSFGFCWTEASSEGLIAIAQGFETTRLIAEGASYPSRDPRVGRIAPIQPHPPEVLPRGVSRTPSGGLRYA